MIDTQGLANQILESIARRSSALVRGGAAIGFGLVAVAMSTGCSSGGHPKPVTAAPLVTSTAVPAAITASTTTAVAPPSTDSMPPCDSQSLFADLGNATYGNPIAAGAFSAPLGKAACQSGYAFLVGGPGSSPEVVVFSDKGGNWVLLQYGGVGSQNTSGMPTDILTSLDAQVGLSGPTVPDSTTTSLAPLPLRQEVVCHALPRPCSLPFILNIPSLARAFPHLCARRASADTPCY
jgi:hypothetical protein